MEPLPVRLIAGLLLAAIIAAAARRVRALSTGGAIAATALGTACVAAGWAWGGLLVTYFVASTLLSRLGEPTKARRTAGVVEKGGARDAWQVLANGGVYALAALGTLVHPQGALDGHLLAPETLAARTHAAALLGAGALGALAAATADTWGTEIGTLARGTPRLVTTWRAVPAGTSGAVSAAGSLATVAGALFIGGAALLLGWRAAMATSAVVGGIVGAGADTLLGATVQARRWCATCAVATERRVHTCGTATQAAGGRAWLDNDRVNLAAVVVGALAAVVYAWMTGVAR